MKLSKKECLKRHNPEWVGFYENGSGYPMPPHALLFCNICGQSLEQRPIYRDIDGKIRVMLGDKPNE